MIEAAKGAFEALKVAIIEAPCFLFVSWDKPFEVWSGASNRALGTILQLHGHPLAFLSCKVNSVKKNQSFYDKKLLGVIKALKHWKHFLYGMISCFL